MATLTPAALRILSDLTVDAQQAWIGALILEKLGVNWEIISYDSGGNKTVTYPQAYGAGVTDIYIIAKAFDATGMDIGTNIDEDSKDNVSFDHYVDDVCTFMYISFEIKETVPP